VSAAFNTPPTSIPTSAQPALHVDNITAHPGSTFAGIGLFSAALAQPMPTTWLGWVWVVMQVAGGVLAGLGK
jgi:hypothetical protein